MLVSESLSQAHRHGFGMYLVFTSASLLIGQRLTCSGNVLKVAVVTTTG